MPPFQLEAPFKPCGDQDQAIDKLVAGIAAGRKHQTLLGVTGSGKTFTMANVVAQVQKPTLVLVHTRRWPVSSIKNSNSFSPTTPWSISSVTTITTSRKPIFLKAIRILPRTHP